MITVHDLTVRYTDGTEPGPWTLAFEPGVHVLKGPNGCGKSTLLGAIAASLCRHQGRVDVLGGDPEHDAQTRARIGYLTAEPGQPGFLTVREVWRMHAALRGEPDWDGVKLERALALPADRRLSQCSSGMRQKAELIGALAGDPPVLLLDEPFANLDAAAVAWLRDRLDLHEGVAILAHHGAVWSQGVREVFLEGPGRVARSSLTPEAPR